MLREIGGRGFRCWVAGLVAVASLGGAACSGDGGADAGRADGPVGAVSAAVEQADAGEAQSPPEPEPAHPRPPIYAGNSLFIGDGVVVNGGGAGVRGAASGPTVVPGFELAIGPGAIVDPAYSVAADSIQLDVGAVVGTVETNEFSDLGATFGGVSAFGTMPELPKPAPVAAGTASLTVAAGTTATLSGGTAYGTVTVQEKATLEVTGGVVQMANLIVADKGTVYSLAPSSLRIASKLDAGEKVVIGPNPSNKDRLNLHIQVSGTDELGGKKAARVGSKSHLTAIVEVPNGTFEGGPKSDFEGIIIGEDVSLGPGSVVDTLPFEPDDNPCTLIACTYNNIAGKLVTTCLEPPAEKGTACTDDNACTIFDQCDGEGACTSEPIPTRLLDDKNSCTIDGCDPATGPTHVADVGAFCDPDGDLCNGHGSCKADSTCDVSAAEPLPEATECKPETACRAAWTCDRYHHCQPGQPVFKETPCTDGNVCNGQEACDGLGECSPGENLPQGASCSDGNICNGAETCDGAGECKGGDGADGVPCFDDNPCTEGDTCQSGVCAGVALAGAACDDGNPCTTNDGCSAGTCAGEVLADGAACDDGNLCNGQETCTAGECVGPNEPAPDDGEPSTLETCDPETNTHGSVDCALGDAGVREVTTVALRAKCFYFGMTPIQTGLDGQPFNEPFDPVSQAAPFDPLKVAILRGRVSALGAPEGTKPLAGVTITIKDHPEFGKTVTRADGLFDLAVEGGGPLRVLYELKGYFPAQRTVDVNWQDYVTLPEVTLLQQDPAATTILLGGEAANEIQVARSSAVTDFDGTRRTTLLFPPGNDPTVLVPAGDGTFQEVNLPAAFNVRATEYTVGATGPAAMPAELPPSTAYTHAIELSIDGVPPDAQVTFTEPVVTYVDNYLAMPVGEIVPAGYFDRSLGVWVAGEDGRVIQITDVVTPPGGIPEALLDTSGATPNPPLENIELAERQKLATLYQKGDTIWRVPINHFSTWDLNWGWGAPPNAVGPDQDPAVAGLSDTPQLTCGSIIEDENQVVGEVVPLIGTPFRLHYQSDRTPGGGRALHVPLIGEKVPEDLLYVIASVEVAGLAKPVASGMFAPAADQSLKYQWSGFDSTTGELLQGAQPVRVVIGYVYPGMLLSSGGGFGSPGGGGQIDANKDLFMITRYRTWRGMIGNVYSVHEQLGGWTIDAHHTYDVNGRTLYLGDGRRRTQEQVGGVIRQVPAFQGWNPRRVAIMPNGDLLVAVEGSGATSLWRATPQGVVEEVVPAGPAFHAYDVAIAPDGAVYVTASEHVVVRIEPDLSAAAYIAGHPTKVCADAICGDGGDAKSAALNTPTGIAVGHDGNIYVADYDRIRRIDTAGKISTMAAGKLNGPDGLAVGADGTVYVADTLHHQVKAVTPDGTVHTIAGNDAAGVKGTFCGEGGPANQAWLHAPRDVAIALDGGLFVATDADRVIHIAHPLIVDTDCALDGDTACAPNAAQKTTCEQPNGLVSTIAGGRADTGCLWSSSVTWASCFDGLFAANAWLYNPWGLAVAPNGRLYIAGTGSNLNYAGLTYVDPTLPGLSLGEIELPSEDGSELYFFSKTGRHLRTEDALTRKVLLSFEDYNNDGLLDAITDADGYKTTIKRLFESLPKRVEITSPFGQTTKMVLNWEGYATAIENPAGETVTATYTEGKQGGLLLTYKDPRLNKHTFEYDDTYGTLLKKTDPVGTGGELTLNRTAETDLGAKFTVYKQRKTGGGTAVTRYDVDRRPNGPQTVVTTPPAVEAVLPPQIVETKLDNTTTTTYPDGTIVTRTLGPDPRFGMRAPIETKIETTTGGKTLTVGRSRTVVNADDNDPTQAVVSQTDTLTVGDTSLESFFDADTNTIRRTTKAGRVTVTSLNAEGRPDVTTVCKQGEQFPACSSATPINLHTPGSTVPLFETLYEYHSTFPAKGRLASITQGTGTLERKYRFWYDKGNLWLVQGPKDTNIGYGFGYDAANRVAWKGEANYAFFDYDANGNLNSLAAPGTPYAYGPVSTAAPEEVHRLDYTAVDLLKSYTPPVVPGVDATMTLAYTADRQVDLVTHGGGVSFDPQYDSLGRVTTVTAGTAEVEYSYYPFDSPNPGKLEKITSSTAGADLVEVSYGYEGSLLTQTTWLAENVSGNVHRAFDSNLRLATETVGGEQPVTYQYDPDGLLDHVGELDVILDPDTGLVAGTTLGGSNGVADSYEYNGFAEVAGYHVKHGGQSKYDVIFERDNVGRITRKTENVAFSGTVETTVTDYRYDNRGRLIDVFRGPAPCGPKADPTPCVQVGWYAYDEFSEGNDNRTGYQNFETGTSIAATYDAQDRLVTYGDWSYEYTPRGTLEKKKKLVSGAVDTTYTYDAMGGLRKVVTPEATIDYKVDGLGRRIAKYVDDQFERGWLYRDGLAVVAEVAAAPPGSEPSIVARFVYGTRAHVPDYMVKDGVTYRFVTDQLGSVRFVVRMDTGEVAQEIEYDEFGRVLSDSAEGFQPFGFAGGLYDPDTGLVRFGARDYDAETGRWTAKDPILFAGDGGTNLYGYQRNDPVNFIDPDGLSRTSLVRLLHNGWKVVKKGLGMDDAVRLALEGEDLAASSRKTAQDVAARASAPGREPIHEVGRYGTPHYHPNPRTGSHIFYEFIGIFDVTGDGVVDGMDVLELGNPFPVPLTSKCPPET